MSGLAAADGSSVFDQGTIALLAGDVAIGVRVAEAAFGGELDVLSGGLAIDTAVGNGGKLQVLAGGTASGIVAGFGSTVAVAGGAAYLLSGQALSGTTVSGGELSVLSGATTTGTAVGTGGEEAVLAGGVASGTVVGAGGEQVVFGGGTASGTAVDAGGTLIDATSGAIAAGATVGSGGTAFVSSGGTASDLAVSGGGTAYLGDGAALTGAFTDNGALVGTETGTLSIAPVISGAGAVVQDGSGTLLLGSTGSANTYTGGSTLSAGTLELANQSAAGTGAIGFAAGADAALRLDTVVTPANTISGFAPGDAIDLRAVPFNAGDTVSAKGNTVTISAPGGATYHLFIAGAGTQGGFALSQAPGGGTRLKTTNAPVTASTVQATAGSGLQFLGGSTAQAGAAAGSAPALLQGSASLSDLVSSLVASTLPGGNAGALLGSAATPSAGSGLLPGGETVPAGALALNGLTTSAGLALAAHAGQTGALA